MTGRRRDPQAALRLPTAIGADIAGSAPGDVGPVQRVAAVWADVVGEALARVSQPARLSRDGTLVVHAADASWVHALTLEQRTVLRRLQERLAGDAPAELRVEIGPISVAPAPAETAPIAISAEALRAAEERTADVADPRLRGALSRAIAITLSRSKTP